MKPDSTFASYLIFPTHKRKLTPTRKARLTKESKSAYAFVIFDQFILIRNLTNKGQFTISIRMQCFLLE
jgi:hypothetical protein